MALTMTRTRTQTTLTKLAEMVANVHGELGFVEGLLVQGAVPGDASALEVTPEVLARLALRRLELTGNRDALYATVRQFDAGVEPDRIGALEEWRKRYGRKGLSAAILEQRYRRTLEDSCVCG
jgi:hypothetical protein